MCLAAVLRASGPVSRTSTRCVGRFRVESDPESFSLTSPPASTGVTPAFVTVSRDWIEQLRRRVAGAMAWGRLMARSLTGS